MKIVFTSQGTDWTSLIDPRFGRAKYLLIFNSETEKLELHDNTDLKEEAHGAGPKTAQLLGEIKPDVIITGNGPGNNAAAVLKHLNTDIYIGAENLSIQDAYEAFKNGKLNKFMN